MIEHTANSPWTISVAQLAQRAGQTKTIDSDFPAPSGIGDEVIGITEGSTVHVQANIDSIVDGLIFNGHVTAPMHAVCTRCLQPISDSTKIDVVAFFPYDMEEVNEPEDDIEILAGQEEADDGNTYPMFNNGTALNLETLLRDNLEESIPLKILCKPDCKGLCSQCGINLNDNPDHHHDITDNRWSALEDFKLELENESKNNNNI